MHPPNTPITRCSSVVLFLPFLDFGRKQKQEMRENPLIVNGFCWTCCFSVTFILFWGIRKEAVGLVNGFSGW